MADEEEQDIPEEDTPNEESLGTEDGANEEEEEEVVILPPEIIPAKEPDCPECKSGAPAWMATFADMATLLMAFFVLILSFAHMNVPKFKNVSGSMKSTFGVQRSVPVVEPPTAQNIIAQNYRTAKVEPTIVDTIEEQKTDVPQPEDQELKSDDGDGEDSEDSDTAPHIHPGWLDLYLYPLVYPYLFDALQLMGVAECQCHATTWYV